MTGIHHCGKKEKRKSWRWVPVLKGVYKPLLTLCCNGSLHRCYDTEKSSANVGWKRLRVCLEVLIGLSASQSAVDQHLPSKLRAKLQLSPGYGCAEDQKKWVWTWLWSARLYADSFLCFSPLHAGLRVCRALPQRAEEGSLSLHIAWLRKIKVGCCGMANCLDNKFKLLDFRKACLFGLGREKQGFCKQMRKLHYSRDLLVAQV